MNESEKVYMFYIHVAKVKGLIVEKGYNLTTFANALGMGRGTLARYLKNPETIPYGIVQKMADLLCCRRTEAVGVFFCDKGWYKAHGESPWGDQ